MKLILKFIVLLYINIFCVNYSLAQTSSLEITSTSKNEIKIPPINEIIDSVLKRNAMLKFRKYHVEVKASTLKSERIYWTRNFGIQADTRYGTYDTYQSSADSQSTATYSSSTTSQINYGVGFYIKFPIFDFLNRKNQVKLAKSELEEAKSMEQFQEAEIRQTVIQLYQNLILKQKLLKIKSESLGNGKVNIQMVEKEFRNGLVPIAEYVRISSMASNMESDYEQAKSDFLIAKQLLEDMAGFVFGITPSN